MVKRKLKAFTILEIVVVLGIFSVITMFLFPLAISQIQGNKIDYEVKILKSAILSLEESAYSGKDNKNYGVALYTDHYILYTGNNLAGADTTTQYLFSPEVSISNINLTSLGSELNFPKGS